MLSNRTTLNFKVTQKHEHAFLWRKKVKVKHESELTTDVLYCWRHAVHGVAAGVTCDRLKE